MKTNPKPQTTGQRTTEKIKSEIRQLQLGGLIIPAGTPDRKQLQRKADCDHREKIAAKIAKLAAELRTTATAAKQAATAARTAANPQEQTRRWLMRWLRRLGFCRDTRTASKSTYYTHGECRVRISNHDVPETDERRHNAENGGFSWVTHGWNLRIDASRMDLARDLVEIRRELT